jgi:hypothetical protein
MLSHVIQVNFKDDRGFYAENNRRVAKLKDAKKMKTDEAKAVLKILQHQRGWLPKLMTIKEAVIIEYNNQKHEERIAKIRDTQQVYDDFAESLSVA